MIPPGTVSIIGDIKIQPGERILLKTFVGRPEYAYLDYNNQTKHSTTSYVRYNFDWVKMNKELSEPALKYYKDVETGRVPGFMTGAKSGNPKSFIGFTDQDVNSRYYNMDAIDAYNKWVNDNTESIKRYDPDLDKYIKSKFCRILVIDIQTNAAPNNPIPNQLFVLYKLLQNPPIVRE